MPVYSEFKVRKKRFENACWKYFEIGREIVFSKGRTITIRRRIACKSQLSVRGREVYNKVGQSDPAKTVAKRAKMQKNAQHVGNVATLCKKTRGTTGIRRPCARSCAGDGRKAREKAKLHATAEVAF